MASDQDRVDEIIVSCPCHEFETLSAVRSALDSGEKTRTLIAWLSSCSSDQLLRGDKPQPLPRLSCQPPGRTNIKCPNRYAVSFLILNGIRDACRSYLEEESSISQQQSIAVADEPVSIGNLPRQPTYEESFPALSLGRKSQSPTVLTTKKKPKKKAVLTTVTSSSSSGKDGNAVQLTKTTKRRIRPAPATVSAWGASSITTTSAGLKGNISMLPSEEPLPLGSNLDRSAVFAGSPKRSPSGKAASRISTLEASRVTPRKRIPLDTTQRAGDLRDVSKELGRLAELHVTLVKSHLVPSTALELHLLVRLLVISQKATISVRETNGGLEDIFAIPGNCCDFAIEALKRLDCIIRLLDLDLLEAFVACPPVEKYLPDLKIDLAKAIEERRRKLHLLETPHGSITSPTKQAPIINLPFEQDRDSRHNYKSRDDAILYKNREESRDAFLYQLRAFQSVRGKVLDPVQTERSIDKIRHASREMVRGLLLANMPWFAEIFCDLLLQIGLVPMEETDKDLLKMADKEKLQKLHKRFSSKNENSSKSSKSLSFERCRAASSLSPVAAAQQYFPGHQEFFFIFLHATDSYSLSFHLRSHLRMKITQICQSIPIAKFGKTVSQLCLLSRFLGMLVFSPCWYIPRNGARDSIFKGETQLAAVEMPLLEVVKQAWQKLCLSSTIPWVVEYLRMGQWDHSFQASLRNSRLLDLLIAIRSCLGPTSSCSEALPENLQVNCQRVCFYLETLLGDIVGLGKIAFLPQTSLTLQQPLAAQKRTRQSVDLLPISASVSELSLGNPHIEELYMLLGTLEKGHAQSTSTPRKLRPNAIRLNTKETLLLSPSFQEAIATQTKHEIYVDNTMGDILPKLKGAFFHQHRELKELCEYAAGRALKNLAFEVKEQAIAPCVADLLFSKPTEDQSLNQIKEEAVAAGREFLRSELTRILRESLSLLSSKETQDQVKRIAAALSVEHSILRAGPSLRAAADEEIKKLIAEQPHISPVANAGGHARNEGTHDDSSADHFDKELALFTNSITNHDWERCHVDVLFALERLRTFVQTRPTNQRSKVASSIFSLDSDMLSLLVWCTEVSATSSVGPHMRWSTAAALLETAASLRYKVSPQSCFSIAAHLSSDNGLSAMIELGVDNVTPDERMSEMCTVIINALETRLIAPSILERVLTRMLESDSTCITALANSVLSRLSSRGAHEKTWAFERLRFRLALMGKTNGCMYLK